MKQETSLSKAIRVILIVSGVIAMLSVWPMNLWPEQINSAIPDAAYMTTEAITPETNVMQEFLPEYAQTDAIQVLVDSLGADAGEFAFHFYDKDLTLLWEAERSFTGTGAVSYFTFPIEMLLHTGEPYYYTLDYVDTPFAVCYDERQQPVQNGNAAFYYALQEIPLTTAITQYHYVEHLSIQKIAIADLCIALAVLLLCIAVHLLLKVTKWERRVTTDKVIHTTLSVLTLAVVCVAAWKTGITKTFGKAPLDIVVYLTGIVLAGITLLYAIRRIRSEHLKFDKQKCIAWIPRCLQTVFFAMAILSCCDFVNAGSNYAQGLALREMCSYLGLAVIASFEKKELLRIWNLLYVVAACAAGYFYVKPYFGQGEPYETAYRTAIMVVIWGLPVIAAIYNLLRKRMAKLSCPMAILTALFFFCLLWFRNNNVWEIAVVVPFTLLYIRRVSSQQRENMLENVANGVILSFIILTYEALCHRPFHYYLFVRYAGMFTTVTVTAVYLSLVFAVSVCKLFRKVPSGKHVRDIFFPLLLLGIVSGYQFLTLSRTGILTCVLVYATAVGAYLLFEKKRNWKKAGQVFLFSVLMILWCIPIVFTAARTIPALISDPVVYEGERFKETILKGEQTDSARFITVSRFLGLSTERILGKPNLEHVTQSGLTVEEALKEAGKQKENSAGVLEESGVTVNEDSISYIDEYGSEYQIETPGYSNGRLDIYRKYSKHLNWEGHAAVGLPEEDGSTIVHAHNSFIQMAYDCGIFTGIVFLVFYILFGLRSVRYYRMKKERDSYAMLPMLLFAAFGIASMVEYVFRPTIPLGFVFLLIIAPLLTRFEKDVE